MNFMELVCTLWALMMCLTQVSAAVFVNVPRYRNRIRESTVDRTSYTSAGDIAKRINQKECERFQSITIKQNNGRCSNARNPPIASLVYSNKTELCNGILVNENHVLTACTCKSNRYGTPLMARIGEYAPIKILNFMCHPVSKDIAIAKLVRKVPLSSNIIPACLPNSRTKYLNEVLHITGYRFSYDEGWVRRQLFQSGSNQVIPAAQCARNLSQINHADQQLCIINKDRQSIRGTESRGAPLQFFNKRTCSSTVVGILNFDSDQRNGILYGFSNIVKYSDWIEKTIWTEQLGEQNSKRALEKPTLTKRISEKECDRFRNLIPKDNNGNCWNDKYSHTVSIVYPDGNLKCTGILLNEYHVLTACHCTKDFYKNGFIPMAKIGEFKTVEVVGFTCHPAYKRRKLYHDLALIKLASSVQLSSNIIPACLASNQTENLTGSLLTTGYRFSFDTGLGEFFKSNANHIITTDQCNRDPNVQATESRLPEGILPDKLCVINNDTKQTSSWGSSGTPLQTINTETCQFTVVGVLNHGSISSPEGPRSANDTVLNIFSRLAYYLGWIEEIVWGEIAVS